jgi:endoglucanase
MQDRKLSAVFYCGVFCSLLFSALRLSSVATAQTSPPDLDAFAYNRLLGRGINLGNALEAPTEGAWGVTLKPEYFEAIKSAGFSSVRLPINWAAHAQQGAPYVIDAGFFERVDWAIDQILSRGLVAVIDVHHYYAMDQDPSGNTPELLALWKQIADRYRDKPHRLLFELFNEPQVNFSDPLWNEIIPKLLQVVRNSNPTRTIIVGPGYWNSADHLSGLKLPRNDRRLIVTFHYYKPMQFTHQGQSWAPESMAWKGTKWGTATEHARLQADFKKAADWATQWNRPVYVGEFGSSEQAPEDARVSWTRAVVNESKMFRFSWAYWQFSSNFGIYDTSTSSWNQPLLDALLHNN